MGFDLQQRIAQVQQKIGAKDAAGQNTSGLLKKLAKLLNRLGAGNTVAGAGITLGIAAMVIPSGAAPSGGPDIAPPGSSVVGSEAGGGLVWGVTFGSDSPTPGGAGTDPGTSTPDQGSSSTPADPGVAPPESGSSGGSDSGGSTDAAGQDTQSGADGSTGVSDTTKSDAIAEYEDGE